MFASLQAQARGLHKVVINFPVGAATPVPFPEEPPAFSAPKRYEQWLRAQIAQYDTALAAEQLTIDQAQDPPFQPDDQDKDSVLLDMIDAVKVELREVAAERGRELDLVSRIRRTAVLTKAMFPDDTAEYRFTLDPAVSERVSERVYARDALVVKFLKCKEEVAAMEATLMGLQTSNLKLQEENRAAMRQLKELMSAASNDQSTSSVDDSAQRQTEQAMKRYTDQYKIICNVFQSLIVASGIDWSVDDKLKDIMFGLSLAPPS